MYQYAYGVLHLEFFGIFERLIEADINLILLTSAFRFRQQAKPSFAFFLPFFLRKRNLSQFSCACLRYISDRSFLSK